MIADMHAHYPMHVINDMDPGTMAKLMKEPGPTLRDRVQALILKFANRVGNYPGWDKKYRVNPDTLRAGGVGLAMSVQLGPFDEMDLDRRYAAEPESAYFDHLKACIEAVEDEVAGLDRAQIRLAHNRAELDDCIAAGATALIHAVEGGCLLGKTDAEIEANCVELAKLGVGYVTVAHLFFRQVATNANALPFLPDPVYKIVFPQCGKDRLTPRGETLVRSLVENRVLIDLSHMDPGGIRETLAVMDQVDPKAEMPVISTHTGYRFGGQKYMCDEEILLQIKRRNGVVGLIMAQHQLQDGVLRGETKTLDESLPVVCKHIDKIAEVTGSHDHIAIGSDLDGFIKPSIGGVTTAADLKRLEEGLRKHYKDDGIVDKITWANALRVLQTLWPKAGSPPA